jgi:hypothetical protein
MKGFIAKAALTALLEKVWLSSGNAINKLEVKFAGRTAGIRFDRDDGLSATVILPAIDETANVSQGFFNDLIGYVLHELGHAWFTDNAPWDDAVASHGKVLGGIVNALEDVREEQEVIRSGYADNARALFVQLANNVFKDGFDNTMIENVAAVIAVEGRRLNDYALVVPDLFSGCPWAEEIADALSDARFAKNTADVVAVAVALWLKIKPEDEEGDEEDDEEGDEEGDDEGDDEGDEGDGDDEGDDGEKPHGDNPSDKPSDEPADEPSDKPDDGGKGGDKPSDKPDGDTDNPKGKPQPRDATGSGEGAIQNIEAGDLIEAQAREASPAHVFKLPLRTKTITGKFDWR